MRIIRILLVFFFVLLCANANGATIKAGSCSYSDVSSAINSASPGDTVQVPAGNCIWNSRLAIKKGIKLIGAGIGNTIISAGANPLIDISPTSNNYLIRVSGFTFDLNNKKGINLYNNATFPPYYKIRIDHNRFTDSTASGAAIENWGCFGLIDNNTFDHMRYPLRLGWGHNLDSWANQPELVYGAANDNIYVEDNVFKDVSTCTSDQDEGGRYVFRFNSITPTGEMYPLFDIHGGRGGLWGGMGGEVYGNEIKNGSGFAMSHRGGRLTYHHNNFETSESWVMNLYNNDGCPPNPYKTEQLHNNSYYFLNRHKLTGSLIGIHVGSEYCGDITENEMWWRDNTSNQAPNTRSNITSGIGCGTLSNLPTSCTNGTAYWVTDQSCTDLSNMVGVNPSTPISGTLYRCESGTMVKFYTPYTYPHPLREGGDLGISAPSNLRIVEN